MLSHPEQLHLLEHDPARGDERVEGRGPMSSPVTLLRSEENDLAGAEHAIGAEPMRCPRAMGHARMATALDCDS